MDPVRRVSPSKAIAEELAETPLAPSRRTHKPGLPALSVFFFTPGENALCQRIDVRRGRLTVCSLAHERIDRSRHVLPREAAVFGSSHEFRDRLSESWRCSTRGEGSRERAPEVILADAHELSRMRNVIGPSRPVRSPRRAHDQYLLSAPNAQARPARIGAASVSGARSPTHALWTGRPQSSGHM